MRATTWSSGADKYDFGALSAGAYYYGSYYDFGSLAYFWSSTEYGSSVAYCLGVGSSNAYMGSISKTTGFSVRCLKD